MSLVALGTADPGLRSLGMRRQQRHGFLHGGDHLLRVDDADAAVGHQGEHAASLIRGTVEDDRAGVGDCDTAGGDDGARDVERPRGQQALRSVDHTGRPRRR